MISHHAKLHINTQFLVTILILKYFCPTVPEAPVQLFCKLTEPTIITVQWSPPPTSPFIYPVREYILQSNTGRHRAENVCKPTIFVLNSIISFNLFFREV